MNLRSLLAAPLILGAIQTPAAAAEYEIDPAHSFVEFRIQHLGFSWLYGRFNDVSGTYSYDADNPEASEINVRIDPASVDTNHAKRDKHLRSEDFLHVDEYPDASFTSTGYSGSAEAGTLKGELTLHGVTRPITIAMKKLGEGKDPWGGYRSGFVGTTTINRKDFGIDYELGPASWEMQLELGIEGVRQ
jgi:polyisoprenoid-binding protein YceI